MSRFKKVAAIQDEFLHLFITLVAVLLPFYWSFLLLFSGGYSIPWYNYCIGTVATGMLPGEEKMWPIKIFVVFTIVNETTVYFKIRHLEKKIAPAVKGPRSIYVNMSLQETEVCIHSTISQKPMPSSRHLFQGSFVNVGPLIKVVFIFHLFFIGGGAAFSVVTKAFQLPFRSVAPLLFFWETFSFGISVPLIYYWHNADMRNKVMRMTVAKIPSLKR